MPSLQKKPPPQDLGESIQAIEIQPDKIRAALVAGLGLCGEILCLAAVFQSFHLQYFVLILMLLFVTMAAFGLILVQSASRLADPRPALIIDSRGVRINIGGSPSGLYWEEIEGIHKFSGRHGRRGIIIMTNKPREYIELQANPLQRQLLSLNHRLLGTPLHLPSGAFKTPVDEVYEALSECFRKYRSRSNPA